MRKKRTSNEGWERVADWYDKLTGDIGHYYHKEIIIPRVIHFLKEGKASKVLDLACGQGVLERALPEGIGYCGVDISKSLLQSATSQRKGKNHLFIAGDVSSTLMLDDKDFDACTVILALQDIKDLAGVFRNASRYLKKEGIMILVINHPCFRIPRQSLWAIDEENKMQSRQLKAYMSSLEVPISVNPGKGERSEEVVYYHHPISYYSRHLFESGFLIEQIEEWTSNKESTGSKARMENRARKEFPLFLCLVCQKIGSPR